MPDPFMPLNPTPEQTQWGQPAMTQADGLAHLANAIRQWRADNVAEGVRAGLTNPNTGWPTTAGWLDAARQYAEGMIAGTSAPGIRAFHGSPYSFDRFDMSKIGTGEGAQAYGHGLYFAGNEPTAQFYRDALTRATGPTTVWKDTNGLVHDLAELGNKADQGDPLGLAANALKQSGSVQEAISDVKKYGPNAFLGGKPEMDATLQGLQKFADMGLTKERSNGSMYEVNLNVRPDQLLDWDKPLSEQSPAVREALGLRDTTSAKADIAAEFQAMLADAKSRGIPFRQHPDYQALAARNTAIDNGQYDSLGVGPLNTGAAANDMRGGQLYQGMLAQGAEGGPAPDQTAASARLRAAGIPGIQYLDAGSRAAGDGTRNYVMFDDSLISILRKYLMPLMTAAGGASPFMGDQHAQ